MDNTNSFAPRYYLHRNQRESADVMDEQTLRHALEQQREIEALQNEALILISAAAESLQPFSNEEHQRLNDALQHYGNSATGEEWMYITSQVGGVRTLEDVLTHARLHCAHEFGGIWTKEEDQVLEHTLASSTYMGDEAWQRLPSLLPHKSVECIHRRYQLLVADLQAIEAGNYRKPVYTYDAPINMQVQINTPENKADDRKKGVPWSAEEHRNFLVGLEKCGKGSWRQISREFVVTRTPSQVASHAQKFFIRQTASQDDRRRPSIHDLNAPEMIPATDRDVSLQEFVRASNRRGRLSDGPDRRSSGGSGSFNSPMPQGTSLPPVHPGLPPRNSGTLASVMLAHSRSAPVTPDESGRLSPNPLHYDDYAPTHSTEWEQ